MSADHVTKPFYGIVVEKLGYSAFVEMNTQKKNHFILIDRRK